MIPNNFTVLTLHYGLRVEVTKKFILLREEQATIINPNQ